MRLSFCKTLLVVCLALLVAVAAIGAVLYAPRAVAKADDVLLPLELSQISSAERQYGDKIYDLVTEDGKIYGDLLTKNDIPIGFKVNASGSNYIKASDLVGCESSRAPSATYTPATVQLASSAGLVQADVLRSYRSDDTSTGWYYLTYEDESRAQTFFAPLQVYLRATDAPYTGCFVVTYNSNDFMHLRVEPRRVTMAYDAANSYKGTGSGGEALVAAEHEGVLYVEHTYGDAGDTIAFAEAEDSKKVMTAFGDVLTARTAFAGNDSTSHVGYYEIETLDLELKRGDKDVSGNYDVSSARSGLAGVQYTGYGVRVVPCPVFIGTFGKERKFTTKRTAYADLYDGEAYTTGTFSSQGFGMAVAPSVVAGQTLTVYYDVVAGQEGLWDVEDGQPREGVVAITGEGERWALAIVGWTVANADESAAYDPQATDYRVEPADGAAFWLQVSAREVVLYDSDNGGVPGQEGEWVDVVANHIAISRPYGYAYTGEPVSYALTLDGTRVTLSFEVKYAGKSLAEYLAAEGEESIILPARTYEIINYVVTDEHYIVELDASVHWTVTKKVADYAALSGWGIAGSYVADASRNATAAQKVFAAYLASIGVDEGICVAEYDYDEAIAERQLNVGFVDYDLLENVVQPVAVAASYPGYYAIEYVNANYQVPAGTLYVRVNPVVVTLSLPADAVYNAERYDATVLYAGEPTNPFAEQGWQVGLTYRAGTRAADPIDAGTYTVSVSVSGPDDANPYLQYNGTGERFSIAAKTVSVTLRSNAQTSKVFGETVRAQRITYTKDGFEGSDDVTLSSDALDANAAPGSYAISATVSRGNAGNYRVTLFGADGRANPKFVVSKIAVDDVLQYFNDYLDYCVMDVSTDTIHLSPIDYNGVYVGGVHYAYAGADGSWQEADEYIYDLAEGTKYNVRIVIDGDGAYIEAGEDIYTDSIEVVTLIEAPTLSQDRMLSSGKSVVVSIDNYDRAKTYAVVAYAAQDDLPQNIVEKALGTPDAEGNYTIARAYSVVDGVDEMEGYLLLDALGEMSAGSEYQVVVVVKTHDSAVLSEPLTVYTRAAAPVLRSASFAVSFDSIEVPEGYYVYLAPVDNNSALPVASVVETTMHAVGLDYATLAASGAELSAEYVEEVTHDLVPNTTYVLAVWTDDEDGFASDVQCFTFKTRVNSANRYNYSGAMLYIAKYLLVGLLGITFVCMLICAIRYAVIKKKLSGGNH